MKTSQHPYRIWTENMYFSTTARVVFQKHHQVDNKIEMIYKYTKIISRSLKILIKTELKANVCQML